MNETLSADFPALTDENRKSVIEMAKFLVLTQNTIVPKMLGPRSDAPAAACEPAGCRPAKARLRQTR